MHEWEYNVDEKPRRIVNKLGEVSLDKPEPINNLITWVYETNSFVPCAKLTENGCYSITNDYIGRPIQAYDNNGNLVWSCDYDIYGNLKNLNGDRTFILFRQLGQYEDVETGLYYNRFRYYDPNSGLYISQDPIGLAGGLSFYVYVRDVNKFVDILGLLSKPSKVVFDIKDLHPDTITKSYPEGIYEILATGDYTADKKALYAAANIKESFSSDWYLHHIDYDEDTNIMRMQLVKKDAHKIGHTGGVKEYTDAHNGIGYETSNKKVKIYKS